MAGAPIKYGLWINRSHRANGWVGLATEVANGAGMMVPLTFELEKAGSAALGFLANEDVVSVVIVSDPPESLPYDKAVWNSWHGRLHP